MSARVLVAVDFSAGSRAAVERAALLPLPPGARLSLVHVLTGGSPRAGSARDEKFAAQAALRKLASRFRASVDTHLVRGKAFEEIVRHAREIGADLVVIGRHGARPVRDLFVGSTATRVVRHGESPVLVVQGRPAHAYRRPVIALDLSPNVARRVVEVARTLCDPDAAAARYLHAFQAPFDRSAVRESPERDLAEYRSAFRKQAKAELRKLLDSLGIEAPHVSVHPGDPRGVIVREARRRRADLIALGTHARGGVARMLLGSVAEGVLELAPCDVLLVRPPDFSFESP